MAQPSKTQSFKTQSSKTQSSKTQSSANSPETASIAHYQMGSPLTAVSISVASAVVFYGLVMILTASEMTSFVGDPLRRYFLGHPIAIAATILFWFAIGSLAAKQFAVSAQNNLLARIFDQHLSPGGSGSDSSSGPADQWLASNDAGHVAKGWLRSLASLQQSTRDSVLVRRLEEILMRQSRRGSSKQLPDDLREVAARDGDAAHDSLGMVRIIVWAIPMLGFLGTVIGITQTLGGLDFTNGSAAVDNLKSGLYVAFDTTAVGLVLSVVAIFLQFPVERSEQRLLADIDQRVGSLVSSNLPSDEASDNQTVLIADLCRGVQAAVAESLNNQAKLWRDTIDTAQGQWQSVHDDNNNKMVDAFKLSLVPALIQHTETLTKSQDRFESMGNIEERLSDNLQALRETSESIQQGLQSKETTRKETDETMADAVRTLARAVDILSTHMSQNQRTGNTGYNNADHGNRQLGRAA
ncbi:MotA/TolQ/ExbB proton channel family protein [Rubripirellula obstinata]|uniref:MotA/TolQ/ExbB proton channel family protein n=1 Tax=Rubripirellula obstinata TaxID=406547 RepID=A0A5B1CL37_9BACT|nr:MotA/TolQ/ExbB proton channel family protein [Rubripirellula obstinata]KAA1260605.1 MotA/TolQ/ExbB proton channel family protein [Rubripirellula obstinata]